MSIVIYLDIILGMNLIFNFLLLMLTNYLAKAGKRVSRLLFGAIIASMLVPLYLYFPHSMIHTMWMKGLYSLFIIFCTFGYHNVQSFFKKVSLFYFTTFAVGGGLIGIQHMLDTSLQNNTHDSFLYVNNVNQQQIHIGLLIIGFPFILYSIKKLLDRQVKDKINYDQMYQVWIEMYGKKHLTMGYIDSGNQLSDPLTNRPVVICDAAYIKLFFSDAEWEKIEYGITHHDVAFFPEKLKKKLFIIPYQGVEGQTGCLYTLKPDKLGIHYQGENLVTNKVLIGIQLGKLTVDEAYHCLLQPELIQLNMVKTA